MSIFLIFVIEKSHVMVRMTVVLIPFMLCSCLQNFLGLADYAPGTYKHSIEQRVMGFRRSYLIHIPKNYNQNEARPLVIALHGSFSTADQMEKESGFSELADKQDFFVLYPNGITLFGWLQHWNAWHCCGFAMKRNVDDLAFISKIIDEVSERFNIDTSRIYMFGYSNGGMLAYLFASQMTEKLAAVAVIGATIGSKFSPLEPEVRIPPPRDHIPVMAIHGRDDDSIPYEGGSLLKDGRPYVSVEESMKFWLDANQISVSVDREKSMDDRVIKETWKGTESDQEVVLYTLEGWDHKLPTKYFTKDLPEKDSLKDFDATEIIWNFFKIHHR